MIYLILLAGFLLRLIESNQSLWLDEAINVLAARNLSFWQFVSSYPIGDFHPPLYFGILWIWSHIFGYSEIFLRLPSIFLGLGTIYLTYLIGKKLFDKNIAILASALLAINPLHIYYSQEARMYSMAAFSATLSFYFFIRLLEDKKWIYLYAFSIVLCLYSDYLVYLVLPSQLLFAVFYKREKIKEVLLGQLLGGIFLIPWLFVFPKQLINGEITAQNVPGWKAVVGGSSFKNLGLIFVKIIVGRVSFTNKVIYGGVVGVIGIFYACLGVAALKKFNQGVNLLICWLVVPIAIAFLVSFYTPVLSYFRMLFLVPSVCLILSVGVYRLSQKYIKLATAIILAISLLFVLVYFLNPKFQREDWKGLISFINQQSPKESMVIFENSDVIAPYKFYDQQKILAVGGLKNFPATSGKDIVDIANITSGKSIIFLVDYLVGISDPNRELDAQLTKNGFKVIKVIDFPSLGFVYEYSH